MTTKWIGPDESLAVGQIGFLVEHSDSMTGRTRFELRNLPAHTNQSHKPRLEGYCGTYNDVATYGRGVVKVVRMAANGRALVQVLEDDALTSALEELGYPELLSPHGAVFDRPAA